MQVLKVDSEITVMYKIIITVLSKYTFFFLLAPHNIYIFYVLIKHHCFCSFFCSFSFFFAQHQENEGRWGPSSLTFWPPMGSSRSPLSATPSDVLHLCSINRLKSCDSSPTRATSIFMDNTYTYGKTCSLHHFFFLYSIICMWHEGGGGGRRVGCWWWCWWWWRWWWWCWWYQKES